MTTCTPSNNGLEELRQWLGQFGIGLGYSINDMRDVIFLRLNSKQISELPDSIGILENLQVLCLNNNQIRELPVSICKLKNLRELYLSNNQISELPEFIGNLSNLQTLNLNNNQISELPDSIGKLKNLQVLMLKYNRFTHLPETLKSIDTLQHDDDVVFQKSTTDDGLQALQQWLEGLGQKYTIDELKNLQRLVVTGKQITSLPPAIGKLSKLEGLILSSNQITSLPHTIGELKNLRELFLGFNQISHLPDSIGELSNLKRLAIEYNQITHLPESISEMSKLEGLWISGNQITELPSSFKKIEYLEHDLNVTFTLGGPGIAPQTVDLLSINDARELLHKCQLTLWEEHDKKIVNDHIVNACENIKTSVDIPKTELKCLPKFLGETIGKKGFKVFTSSEKLVIIWE